MLIIHLSTYSSSRVIRTLRLKNAILQPLKFKHLETVEYSTIMSRDYRTTLFKSGAQKRASHPKRANQIDAHRLTRALNNVQSERGRLFHSV